MALAASLVVALTTPAHGSRIAGNGPAAGSCAGPPGPPQKHRVEVKDVCYSKIPKKFLDLYLPEHPVPLPPGAAAPYPSVRGRSPVTILFANNKVDKSDPSFVKYQAPWFNSLNHIYVRPDYSSSRDVAAVISWAESHIARYGGDPTKIYLMGYEGGANILANLMLSRVSPGFNRRDIVAVTLIQGTSYPRVINPALNRRKLPPFLIKYSDMTQKALDYAGLFSSRPEPANKPAVNAARQLIATIQRAHHVARPWQAELSNSLQIVSNIGFKNNPETQVQLDFIEAVNGAWVFTRQIKFPSKDPHGRTFAGIGSNRGQVHDGAVYAPFASWNQGPIVWPFTKFGFIKCGTGIVMNGPDRLGQDGFYGGWLAVKRSARSPWEVEHYFGPKTLRVGGLQNLTITTDGQGHKLPHPVQILFAGVSTMPGFNGKNFQEPIPTYAFYKVAGGPWKDEELWPNSVSPGGAGTGGNEGCNPETRIYFSVVDPRTHVDEIFAGTSNGLLFKGTYDPATKTVIFQKKPSESVHSGRPLSWAELHGKIYVGIGLKLVVYNPATGKWTLLHAWPGHDDQSPRGLTVAPNPRNPSQQALLSTRVGPEPSDGHTPKCINDVTVPGPTEATTKTWVELHVNKFYDALWGSTGFVGSNFCINTYNNWVPWINYRTGQEQFLGGQWVEHPTENIVQALGSYPPFRTNDNVGEDQIRTVAPFNGTWILYRPRLGGSDFTTYGNQLVFDYNHPEAPGTTIQSVRWIQPSPFHKRQFYLGGFDGYVQSVLNPPKSMPSRQNAGWLYLAQWSKDIGY
jgi:hypothetical protein